MEAVLLSLVGGLIGVLLGLLVQLRLDSFTCQARGNSLVDSAGGGCLSRSWDIFWSSQLKEQQISIRLSPYVQIEGGNHALVRACADSSAGALGESATLYVNYARSDYRCQCDDLSFSSWVGTQKFLVDLFRTLAPMLL